MPNSEVKRCSADGSVGPPHVRVGNCQALNKTRKPTQWVGFFAFGGLATLNKKIILIADKVMNLQLLLQHRKQNHANSSQYLLDGYHKALSLHLN